MEEILKKAIENKCDCAACTLKKALASALLQELQKPSEPEKKKPQEKESVESATAEKSQDIKNPQSPIPPVISEGAVDSVINLLEFGVITKQEARNLLCFDGVDTHWILS